LKTCRREAIRPAAVGGERVDRQRGRGRGEHGVRSEQRVELAQQPGLRVVVLDDRLNDERALREVLARIGHLDAGVEPVARLVRRLRRARAQQHPAMGRGDRREPAPHRPPADDREALGVVG
jgi:hypothetical protein